MTTGTSQRGAGWRHLAAWAVVGVGWAAVAAVGRANPADPPTAPKRDPARRAVAPIAPSLPAEVVAALQGGQYAEAIAALDLLIADPQRAAADRAFDRLVRGGAARLAGRPDDARTTWLAAIEAEPKGIWANKLRGELAALELATGHPDRAEVLARFEAEALLDPARKDRLAEVYRDFARRLLEPEFPGARSNPAAAYALLARGRDLAKGPVLRAQLLFDQGRAGQAAFDDLRRGNPSNNAVGRQVAPPPAPGAQPDPIRDYNAYLQEYPQGQDRDRVRFHLGETLLDRSQPVEARLIWTDLARDLAKIPAVEQDKERQALRGQALYGIARTHGIPNPGSKSALNLGVAALRRFLRETPADLKAPLAAFEIGESSLNQGEADRAIAAFGSFLKGEGYRVEGDEARRSRADLAMRATFLMARATLGQGKFSAAIVAFESYLNQYPNGSESGDARRAILDAQFALAQDASTREKYDEARGLWLKFAETNPLDGRVPAALFLVGETFADQKRWDEAIAAWDALAARFPGDAAAEHGKFAAAAIFETEKGEPAAAIERFRKVAGNTAWAVQADQRIAVMEAHALTVITPRTFRSGETAQLKVRTRNLANLTFSAYKLNPEAYFRKKHALGGVNALDIGLVAPDAEWTVPVPGYAKYKLVEANFDLKFSLPGVYVVKVSDEKTLQASALVIGSDLEAIVKVARDQVLVFAQDMKSGRGRAGARVLIADGEKIVFEATTGPDGVAQGDWSKKATDSPNAPLAAGSALQTLVLDGLDAAGSGLAVPDQVPRGLSPRAYIDTDRPAYRPGQEVLIRGVIREAKDGQYANPASALYKLEVVDSQGRTLMAKETTLSPFGTFQDAIRIDSGAPVGSYRVRVWQAGGVEFAGGFEVQSYQLAKLGLEFDLPRTVFYRGETVKATLQARYGYDAPAAGRPITVQLPDGRTLTGQTDAKGQFLVEFPTESSGEDQVLRLVARLPADNVAARAAVRIAVQGFGITLTTPRSVYLDGETFTVTATTLDALGQPTGQDLRVAVIKPVRQASGIVEREIGSHPLRTDQATGRGQVALRVEEAENATVILRVLGTDQFGNAIVADHPVTISGKDDDQKLRILADRTNFRVGEAASVRLINRAQPGTALVAWEADRILRYQLVPLVGGENVLGWTVDGPQFPNFTLTASRMVDQRFDQAQLDVAVERDLRITLRPKATSVAPGAEIEVEITAEDQMGRPAQAELALALVDRTLLRQFGDKLPPIGAFFYDQTRLGSFATEATNTFSDHPTTELVPNAVVEEADRQLAFNNARLEFRKLGVETAATPPALANAPGAPPPSGGGSMGGSGGMIGESQPERRFGLGLDVAKDRDKNDSGFDTDRPSVPSDETPGEKMVPVGRSTLFAREGLMAGPQTFAELSDRRRSLNLNSRQSFVETAYWNPAVVTGTDGKATVKFRAPAALSEYRLMAKGVTGADSLVGQNSANLVVRQDFYVDLRTPARLTEGDKPRFVAQVHHVGIVAGTVVRVRLSSYAGDQDAVDPKEVTIAGDGVTEVLFDPITIPDAESIHLTATARAGDRVDEVVAEVPIQPWGVQALATASGTASDDRTAFVGLPPGRRYDDLALQIQLAPTVDRLVVELALGRGSDAAALPSPFLAGCRVIVIDTTADRASGLLAAAAALTYLRDVRSTTPGESARVLDRARGLVGELVSSQNADGGWAWVPARAGIAPARSDRLATSSATWALGEARAAGIDVDPGVITRAGDYLATELNRTGTDLNGRAAVLLALAVLGRGNFEATNSLNRGRQNLGDVALAHLALTFGRLDRASLAGEVLDLLASRAKTEPVGPGEERQTYWDGKDQGPWNRARADTTALVTLAFARVGPHRPELKAGVAWLLAHRSGPGWSPRKAVGPAVAAIAALQGKAGRATDRYRLLVTVNDTEVARLDVVGATESRTIAVPRNMLKLGAPNAIRFQVEGRGTYGYAATLTGFARDFAPEQQRDGKLVVIDGHDTLPSSPELDGVVLPTGFAQVVNPTKFVNKASEVTRGGRVRVEIRFDLAARRGLSSADREFLIVEETLPAGTTLVDGSVATSAGAYTLRDGVLSFAFATEFGAPMIRYEVAGYLPGQYRTLPTAIRDAYDPGTVHLGPTGSLRVLAPGEPATDPYRATPDELVARGKALAAAERWAEAAAVLEELFTGYTPTDEVARDAARIALTAHIQSYDARKVVRDFEILKEKGPEVIIPFDEVLVVARAYRDLGEFERAFLVSRALAEASYLEDAQVGEALRRNGQPLEAITYLLDLWCESPGSASIEGDLFGLSQVLTDAAGRAFADPILRDTLARAQVARPELLLQSIRLIQTTLALSPQTPLADEASLALLSNELDLENFEAVTRLAPRFAAVYSKSPFLDSFQYADALSRFQLGQYDRAIEIATKIAQATYPDPAGVPQPSPNKWQALYILGQIHDARRQPAQAIGFYQQVADRFSDAADAVLALNRQALKLPEVTIVRPTGPPPVKPPGAVVLASRNITEVDLKVYPVDLMRLYLTRRNLDAIAGIDLAGITPLHEATVKLGDALTYADATRTLDLPLSREGAYLVMVRGGDLYASGIVLVSPIELEVTEEADAGRVRVVVRDAASQNFVPRVQVKVIGSNNTTFTDGRTDLRGVAVAEGIAGQVTAVARNGLGQYAFYRGTGSIGGAAATGTPRDEPRRKVAIPAAPQPGGETLDQNLRGLNLQNQNRGIDRLQNRFLNNPSGIRAQEAR